MKRQCPDCGKSKLKDILEHNNSDLLKTNKRIKWHHWQIVQGRTVSQKLEIKGTLRSAMNEFVDMVGNISAHLFQANWHRYVFQYIKGHLISEYLLQVMDFAMNFSNCYQDEIQSAYYRGTQMTIHATINFYKCLQKNCQEIVTLALVHISDDLKHDSFFIKSSYESDIQVLSLHWHSTRHCYSILR